MADLISRAAAIEAFDDERVDRNYGDVSPESVIKVIESISTVDAAPVVHGRWVADSDGLPVCSVCGEIAMQRLFCDTTHGEWRYDVRLVKTPFCPNCGAKMDGDGDG